jgi:hypothetical protein
LNNDLKKRAIMKLFAGFPSVQAMNSAAAAAMMTAYLENIQTFSDDAVCEAVESIRKLPSQFPPSAGELYDACAAVASRRYRENANRVARIEHRRERHSDEHREMMRAKWAALLDEIKFGVNFNTNYGRVAPGTRPTRPIVERTVPKSFLAKWEADKGYQHPQRERIMDVYEAKYGVPHPDRPMSEYEPRGNWNKAAE